MTCRDSDARMRRCAALWKRVAQSIATVSVRLIASSFMTWHMQCGEGAASKWREHVANKAMRRLQNHDIGHAWGCWYEQHVKLVRLRILSTRVLKRWTHGAIIVAWMTWSEECTTSKSNAWTVQKSVKQWEKMKYAKAFGAWHEHSKAQRKFRGAEKDAKDNLYGMENVGDMGEGVSTTKGPAGEDGAANAKRRHVQGRMGLVVRQCYRASTAEESAGEAGAAYSKTADSCSASKL